MALLEQLNQFDFHHHLQQQAGTSVVVFTSPRCGSCKAIKQAIRDFPADPAMAFYEVDAVRDSALVSEFEVGHLPALYLFLDGHFHCELHSQALPGALAQAIAQAKLAPAMEAP